MHGRGLEWGLSRAVVAALNLGGQVCRAHGSVTKWQVRFDGKLPRIEELTVNKLGAWAEVLREFLPKAAPRISEE